MWSLNLEATGRPGNTILVEHEPEYTKKEAKFQFTRRIHLTGIDKFKTNKKRS